mgnify:CR=1 FL=1
MPLPNKDRVSRRENAQDLAYQQLREWIVDGPLDAGEVVRDTEVAELLEVSRTPVREALIRLAQEGLIDFARGRGTRVAPLRYERAPELYQVGAELDGMAADLATPYIEEQHLEQMREVLRRMAAETDLSKLRGLDEEFHGVYYECAGNSVLIDHLTQINFELARLERVAFRDAQIRAEAHREHLAIIDALAGHDREQARLAAWLNWINSWERIHRRIATMLADRPVPAARQPGATVRMLFPEGNAPAAGSVSGAPSSTAGSVSGTPSRAGQSRSGPGSELA